jgi:hypothetical protein
MLSKVRNCCLLAALLLVCAVAFGLADPGPNTVPEGGSELAYLAVAAVSCVGVMFYKFGR